MRVCDDHIVIDDTLQILRVPYFEDKMAGNLPSFWGFVPRWYIPHVALQFDDYEYPVTLTLMIVDSAKENYVSIGWDWPPIRIDKGGILVQELVLDYIESSIGSAVTLPLDFSGFFGDKALVKLLSLMVLEVDGVYVDFDTRELCFNDGADTVPLAFLGLTDEDYIIDVELTVQQTYEEPNGRFSLVFGNAAMIDCNWVFPELLDAIVAKVAPYEETHEELYKKTMKVVQVIEERINDYGLTFCKFAFDLEGVLKD